MSIVVSDNRERECLNLISMYKDDVYIKNLLKKSDSNLSCGTLDSVAKLITSYISQGLELYRNADDNLSTSSLLLFYAFSNFAKAIFYIKYPNDTIDEGHGISFPKENDNITDIGECIVKLKTKGAFISLLKVTNDELPEKGSFRLKDIFAVIPELNSVYAVRYMQEPDVFMLRRYKNNDWMYKVEFQTNESKKLLGQDYSFIGDNYFKIQFSESAGKLSCTLYKTEACTDDNFNNVMYHDAYGNLYLTRGFQNGRKRIKLSKISSLYLSYFAFSNYTRYYPEKWMNMCGRADSTVISKLVLDLKIEMLTEVTQLLTCKEIYFANKLPEIEDETDMHELWNGLKSVLKEEKIISGKSPLAFLE